MDKEFVFFATGDVGMNRKNPETIFDGVRDTLKHGDLIFGQLEPCLAKTGSPAAQSRLPMRGDPDGARVIKEAGYDVISFATNHCMDWGPDAFFETINAIKNNNIRMLGAGADIDEARKPVIVEVNGCKIGFLGYNSILPQNYFASKEKPGCNPMRALTVYEQVEHDQPGTPCRIHTFPLKDDLENMVSDIKKLRVQVDILMMSYHWGIHFIPAILADYQKIVAHAAIDAGADIILGHHTHILKPIEVYKGKVIFYSLANFALDPPQAFDENLFSKPSHKVVMSLNKSWKDGKKSMPPDSYKSILCKCIIKDKKIDKVTFLPVHIDDNSNPFIVTAKDDKFFEIVKYMQDITENQELSTKFVIEGNEVNII